MLLLGIGYGAASLGCTLPLFLTLVGAALGANRASAGARSLANQRRFSPRWYR